MKILYVLENFHPKIGGVETLFKNLTDELSNKGHEITILTNRTPGDDLIPRERINKNLYVVRVPFINRYLFTFLAWIPALFLAKGKDLIHTTSYNAAIPSFLTAFFMRKKSVITFHEVWGNLWFDLPFFSKFSLRLHYWFEQTILKIPFKKFIAVSEYTKNQLIKNGVEANKVHRIYNGIEYGKTEKVSKEKNNPFRFLYFGRLGISKGLDVLLEATSMLDADFELHLIVPNNDKKFLKLIKDLMAQLKISEKIVFHHNLPKAVLIAKVQKADTVIVPSYSEGFCFTAVETIALETPIIASKKGALSEVVSGTHLFFDPFTSEELSIQMKKAMEGKFVEAEKKIYELEDSILAYQEFYKTVLNQMD